MTPAATSAMFASAMGSFAEAARESIQATIESKFNAVKVPNQPKNCNGNDVEAKLAAHKQEIAGLKRKLATADGQSSDGSGGRGTSSGRGGNPKCEHCGRKHKGMCWRKKENRLLAPGKWCKANKEE